MWSCASEKKTAKTFRIAASKSSTSENSSRRTDALHALFVTHSRGSHHNDAYARDVVHEGRVVVLDLKPARASDRIDRNTAIGKTWMHISGDVSAGMGRHASHYDGYLGRDSVQDAWVYIFVDALGGYGAFQSTASPRAPLQHWIGVFPTYNNGSFVLRHLSDTRYVIDFPLTIGKKKTSVHQDCRRS